MEMIITAMLGCQADLTRVEKLHCCSSGYRSAHSYKNPGTSLLTPTAETQSTFIGLTAHCRVNWTFQQHEASLRQESYKEGK